MSDCLFCAIASNHIDSAKVYEDQDVVAFLDVNPLTQGHCLVVPKKHAENIFDIEKSTLEKVAVVAKSVSQNIKDRLHAQGIRLSQSSGAIAGQVIFHFHLHIIPRYANDGISMTEVGVARPQNVPMNQLKEIARKIKG
jgi:histidine triad (HIT) family protein